MLFPLPLSLCTDWAPVSSCQGVQDTPAASGEGLGSFGAVMSRMERICKNLCGPIQPASTQLNAAPSGVGLGAEMSSTEPRNCLEIICGPKKAFFLAAAIAGLALLVYGIIARDSTCTIFGAVLMGGSCLILCFLCFAKGHCARHPHTLERCFPADCGSAWRGRFFAISCMCAWMHAYSRPCQTSKCDPASDRLVCNSQRWRPWRRRRRRRRWRRRRLRGRLWRIAPAVCSQAASRDDVPCPQVQFRPSRRPRRQTPDL